MTRRVRSCACGRTHAATEVVAVGRFQPDGPAGYRPAVGGELRPTRAAAMRDVCESWAPVVVEVARTLVTSSVGGTPLTGFTLEAVPGGGWLVRDGRDAAEVDTAADALRTYADFITTFLEDQDETTAALWALEVERARRDAAQLEGMDS